MSPEQPKELSLALKLAFGTRAVSLGYSHRRCVIWGLEGRVPTPSEGELPAKRDVPLAIRWRQISATSLAARSAALEGILQLGASGRVWHVPGCEVIQIQTQFWPSWSYGALQDLLMWVWHTCMD